MALQFTPIAFGVMLVVAVGTLAYTFWNSNRPSQNYSSKASSFDCGYDTHNWVQQNSDENRRKIKKKNQDVCTICLDALKDNIKTLSCKHVFHKHCITMWFVNNNTCPVCRTSSNNTQ